MHWNEQKPCFLPCRIFQMVFVSVEEPKRHLKAGFDKDSCKYRATAEKSRIIHFWSNDKGRIFFMWHVITDKSHRNSIISAHGFIFFFDIETSKCRNRNATMILPPKVRVCHTANVLSKSFWRLFMFAKRIYIVLNGHFSLNDFHEPCSVSRSRGIPLRCDEMLMPRDKVKGKQRQKLRV